MADGVTTIIQRFHFFFFFFFFLVDSPRVVTPGRATAEQLAKLVMNIYYQILAVFFSCRRIRFVFQLYVSPLLLAGNSILFTRWQFLLPSLLSGGGTGEAFCRLMFSKDCLRNIFLHKIIAGGESSDG